MIDLLNKTGEALYGPHFQRELSKALGVAERTMRRWQLGEFQIPPGIRAELAALVVKRQRELQALLKELS